MMTKTKKKIVSIVVAVTMLCPMCAASVSAANTTDVAWTMTSSSVFKYLGASRIKTNSTPIYFKMGASVTSNQVDVKILGVNSISVTGWSQLTNCTVNKNGVAKNYARCAKGVNYSLHSTVYEHGFSRVTLAMRTPSNDTISGIWSADSTGTYNEAPYY